MASLKAWWKRHLCLLLCMFLFSPAAYAGSYTWTDTPEWASGQGKDVTWTVTPGQVELIKQTKPQYNTPYIYIPHENPGGVSSVSQLDTRTGKINWVFSLDKAGVRDDSSPSRTTVDPNGDVWVGLRNTNKVVWIHHLGQQFEVVTTGQRPRAMTVDLNGDIWTGAFDANTVSHIDGKTKQVKKTYPLPQVNGKPMCPYGLASDVNGTIWGVSRCGFFGIFKMDIQGKILGTWDASGAYGIASDSKGQVWVTNFEAQHDRKLYRFDNNGNLLGTSTLTECRYPRGVAVDGQDRIWVGCSAAGTGLGRIWHVGNDGTPLNSLTGVGTNPAGVAIDAAGFVWFVSMEEGKASGLAARVNIQTYQVDLHPTGGAFPYTYSDMTGFQWQHIKKSNQGTWTAQHKAPCPSRWQNLMWNEILPPSTKITAAVRVGNSAADLAAKPWTAVQKGPLPPALGFAEIFEVRFELATADATITPALLDVTVAYTAQKILAEECNGRDDNCDGRIDENVTRPCETPCGKGTQQCIQADWSTCTAPQPSLEICDGRDNDCDGKVDEGADICVQGSCIQGFCVGPCRNGECPQGSRCVNNLCEPIVCTPACPKGQICRGGQCAQGDCGKFPCPADNLCKGGQCTRDLCKGIQCPTDMFCNDGKCLRSCSSVRCKADESCSDGLCVVDSCRLASCGGQGCKDGQCVPSECQATADCLAGSVCQNKVCIDDPCVGVTCPQGQQCLQGQCFGPQGPLPPVYPEAPDAEPVPDGGTVFPPDSTNPGDKSTSDIPSPGDQHTSPIDITTGADLAQGDDPSTTPRRRSPGCACSSSDPAFSFLLVFALLALLLRRRSLLG